jgi:hypothetical protein
VGVGFVNLLKELVVGDSLLEVGDDVFDPNACEGVAVLELAVCVLSKSFIAAHPHSGEVMSVTKAVVGRLVIRHEEP